MLERLPYKRVIMVGFHAGLPRVVGEINMKSEALEKIHKFRRQILTGLYNQCTLGQQSLFNHMYGSLTTIPETKIDWAIQQCENTIKRNKGL